MKNLFFLLFLFPLLFSCGEDKPEKDYSEEIRKTGERAIQEFKVNQRNNRVTNKTPADVSEDAKQNDIEESKSVNTKYEYENSSTYSNSEKCKCDWCGGIGRVGYSGRSEKQYKRTGKGLGFPCMTCEADGKVDC